jgi:transcriptional regulator with XRE-family HTH domain
MEADELVRTARADAGLSIRRLAQLSDVAVSTVHRIERGDLRPTVDTLDRIIAGSGHRLALEVQPDYGQSVLGLGLAIRDDLMADDTSAIIRKAAELVHRFETSDSAGQQRLLFAEPPLTGDPRWDAFLAGLAEWLAAGAGIETPGWALRVERFLGRGWWVTPMVALQAWEFAGTPVSLQRRGVFIHRESLTNR